MIVKYFIEIIIISIVLFFALLGWGVYYSIQNVNRLEETCNQHGYTSFQIRNGVLCVDEHTGIVYNPKYLNNAP